MPHIVCYADVRRLHAMPFTSDEGTTYYSSREAAALLGLAPSSVRYAIFRGALRTIDVDERTHLITGEEIERYRRENLGKRGRPRKDRTKEGTP
jgi:hypothetical protein